MIHMTYHLGPKSFSFITHKLSFKTRNTTVGLHAVAWRIKPLSLFLTDAKSTTINRCIVNGEPSRRIQWKITTLASANVTHMGSYERTTMHSGEYELLPRCFGHGMCDSGRRNDNRNTIAH